MNKQAKITIGLLLILAGTFTVIAATKSPSGGGGNLGGGDEPEAFDPSPGGAELEADMPTETLTDDSVTGDGVPNDVEGILGLSEAGVNG